MPAEMRRGVFENAILIRGFLLNDGHRANPVCGVNAMQGSVISRSVNSCANGQDRDNRSAFRIHDDQLSVSRGAEQTMMFGIKGEARGSFARIKFVTPGDGLFLRI